eukprot:344181-Pyramimonas_sp.AAC.1
MGSRGLANNSREVDAETRAAETSAAARHRQSEVSFGCICDFGISTSGAGQKLSLAALKFNCRQLSSDACSEDMFLKVALHLPNRGLNKVIDSARRIWLET